MHVELIVYNLHAYIPGIITWGIGGMSYWRKFIVSWFQLITMACVWIPYKFGHDRDDEDDKAVGGGDDDDDDDDYDDDDDDYDDDDDKMATQ